MLNLPSYQHVSFDVLNWYNNCNRQCSLRSVTFTLEFKGELYGKVATRAQISPRPLPCPSEVLAFGLVTSNLNLFDGPYSL